MAKNLEVSAAIYSKASGLQDTNHCRYPCEACAGIAELEIVSLSRDLEKRMTISMFRMNINTAQQWKNNHGYHQYPIALSMQNFPSSLLLPAIHPNFYASHQGIAPVTGAVEASAHLQKYLDQPL